MEITVRPVQPTNSRSDPLVVVPVTRSGSGKDRRKKKQDRRKNVREGVFVSLSVKEERRQTGERRKADD